MRELLHIAVELGLEKATFELVAQSEGAAIVAAGNVGFYEVAVLEDNIRDLVVMELNLKDWEGYHRRGRRLSIEPWKYLRVRCFCTKSVGGPFWEKNRMVGDRQFLNY